VIERSQTLEELRNAIAQMTDVMRATLMELAAEACILFDGATRAELDTIIASAVERIPAAGLAQQAPCPASTPLCRNAVAAPGPLQLVRGGGSHQADTFVEDPTRAWTADELRERMSLLPVAEPPVEGTRTVLDRRGAVRGESR
jgi:hypothetical protein